MADRAEPGPPPDAPASPLLPAADPLAACLETAAQELLRAATDGLPAERRLRIADLAAGDVGVLEASVEQVGDVRPFRRRRGGEGLLCRVTLADATGQVDLVLWDDETRWTREGPLLPGAAVRLHGPTVKAGFRGGIELHVGAARLDAVSQEAGRSLEGSLGPVGDARVVGAPPHVRFNAEAVLDTAEGEVRVVLWDACLKAARELLPGARVRLDGATPHPALDGWFLAKDGATLRRL